MNDSTLHDSTRIDEANFFYPSKIGISKEK